VEVYIDSERHGGRCIVSDIVEGGIAGEDTMKGCIASDDTVEGA